jgi:uncharacterized OsmC-like protein
MTQATQKQTRNGIDLEALAQTVAAIQEDPARARVSFGVTTRWTGQTRTESEVTGCTIGGVPVARRFTMAVDEPLQLLGSNTAPNPQEMLMAALNACMAVGYVAGAAVEGITLDAVTIETEGDLDLRGFLGLDPDVVPGYDAIRYRVTVRGNGTPQQFRAIHENVMKTSPNYFNLSRPIRLEADLVIG